MDKKVVFFDFDGTLVDESEQIYTLSEATKQALLQLRQNNILTFLCTGRSYAYIPKDLGDFFTGYICCNGAAIVVDGIEIYKKNIENLDAQELLNFVKENNIGCVFEHNMECHYTVNNIDIIRDVFGHFSIDISDFKEMPKDLTNYKPCKCFIMSNKEASKIFYEKYKNKFNVIVGKGGIYFDFNAKGVSKATGILKVLERYNINIKNTYAFGDGDNDVEMFKCVENAIAIEKHSDKLDEYAKFICPSVKDEGVSVALKKLKLI